MSVQHVYFPGINPARFLPGATNGERSLSGTSVWYSRHLAAPGVYAPGYGPSTLQDNAYLTAYVDGTEGDNLTPAACTGKTVKRYYNGSVSSQGTAAQRIAYSISVPSAWTVLVSKGTNITYNNQQYYTGTSEANCSVQITPSFNGSAYQFVSWSDGNTSSPRTFSNEDVSLTASNLVLKKRYTIAFNKNHGSGSISSMGCVEGETYNLTANKFTRKYEYESGREYPYIFTGWNTAEDGSGTAFSDGASVSDVDFGIFEAGATITLYAQWRLPRIFILNADTTKGKIALYKNRYLATKNPVATQSGHLIAYDNIDETAKYVVLCTPNDDGWYGAGVKNWSLSKTLYSSNGGYGSSGSAVNTTEIPALGNSSVKGKFVYAEKTYYALTVNAAVYRDADVTMSPSPNAEGKYESGKQVTVHVSAYAGRRISGYSFTKTDAGGQGTGGDSGVLDKESHDFTFVVDGNIALDVTFKRLKFTVKAKANALASTAGAFDSVGITEQDNGRTSSPGADGFQVLSDVAYGCRVALSATPNSNYSLAGWEDVNHAAVTPANPQDLFSLSEWNNSSSRRLRSASNGTLTVDVNSGKVRIQADVAPADTDYGESGAYYNIDVTPNTTYLLSYVASKTAGTPALNASVYVVALNESYAKIVLNTTATDEARYYLRYDANDANNAEGHLFTAPAGCSHVQLSFNNEAAGTTVEFSDISFRAAAVTQDLTFYARAMTTVSLAVSYTADTGKTAPTIAIDGGSPSGSASKNVLLGDTVGYSVSSGDYVLTKWANGSPSGSSVSGMSDSGRITVASAISYYAVFNSAEQAFSLTVQTLAGTGASVFSLSDFVRVDDGETFEGVSGEAVVNRTSLTTVALTAAYKIGDSWFRGWYTDAENWGQTGHANSRISGNLNYQVELSQQSQSIYMRYGSATHAWIRAYTASAGAGSSGGSVNVTSDYQTQNQEIDNGLRVLQGKQATIHAVPNSGYRFAGWFASNNTSVEPVSEDADYTFEAIESRAFWAKFEQDTSSIFVWEGSGENKTMTWRSKTYVATRPFAPSACRVDANGYDGDEADSKLSLTVDLFSSPDEGARTTGHASLELASQNARRLPMRRPERYMQAEVVANVEVDRVIVGTSMEGLAT